MAKQRAKQWNSTFYRLVISYLREDTFGIFPILGKTTRRQPGICPGLERLKGHVLELILSQQAHRGLACYTIAWQTHQSNGLAHLDILLKYDRPIKKTQRSFDYLLHRCPQELCLLPDERPRVDITPYSLARFNMAILEYGQKEDPHPLTTFSPEETERHLTQASIKKDPFCYFDNLLRRDPHNFDLAYYAHKYNLMKYIHGWSAIKAKLNDSQSAARALQEQKKPGIRPITRELIQARLSPAELAVFDAHPCFSDIVEYINQIPSWGFDRPHKTRNLFIWGPKGIGKTSFLNQGPTSLAHLVPHYDINLQNRYLNRYYNRVYGFISWNQFKYTDFSPTWILKLLQGLDLEIPIRYSSNIKRDNPLIIATSNMSLTEHIERRFRNEPRLIEMARSNLVGQRIVQIHVPVPMFFMQKLLVSAAGSDS